MIFTIIEAVVICVLIGLNAYLYDRQNKAFDQIARTVAGLIENDKKIDAVDQSTGADIYQLRKDFEQFKTDYGEAAIEQMREAARSEKAWADGVNSIMSYGARFQGGGNAK